jgi:tRNA-2-methylthio-N6-dimethylallyladenosine synthase
LLERARVRHEAQAEFAETLETFPSLLPARRRSVYSAWVAISVGCNNTCTFCIVPALRGKEKDRRPGDILAEIRALVADGVLEVTLLGQNVNSYGAEFGDRTAFGKLLRGCGEIEGLERVRFTSPHPRDFTDDVIDSMADTANVMPSLHMPLQSGSDKILKAMRRAYRRDRYLAILDRVRAKIPDAAITTDIIVGFPGETDQDFEDTLDLVRQARFAGAFTFRYSIRPGTPAATMDAQVPADTVQERYERLTALVEETTYEQNAKQAGACVEVLVAEGEGRKDAATHRMSGRARDNRLVHFAPHETTPRPGDIVTVTVTRGAPHYLLADGAPLSVRRTRAGDAWQAAAAPRSAAPRSAAPPDPAPTPAATPVLLGMPAPQPRPSLLTHTLLRYSPVDYTSSSCLAFSRSPLMSSTGTGNGTGWPISPLILARRRLSAWLVGGGARARPTCSGHLPRKQVVSSSRQSRPLRRSPCECLVPRWPGSQARRRSSRSRAGKTRSAISSPWQAAGRFRWSSTSFLI